MENQELLNTVPKAKKTSPKEKNADAPQKVEKTIKKTTVKITAKPKAALKEKEQVTVKAKTAKKVTTPTEKAKEIKATVKKTATKPIEKEIKTKDVSDKKAKVLKKAETKVVKINSVVTEDFQPKPIEKPSKIEKKEVVAKVNEKIVTIATDEVVNLVNEIESEHHIIDDIDDIDEFDPSILEGLNLTELVELLEETVETNIEKSKAKIAAIKSKFLYYIKSEKEAILEEFEATGGLKEDFKPEPLPIEIRFNEAFKIYKDKKAQIVELVEKQKTVNLEEKKQLLAELKTLIDSDEPLKKTYDSFKDIQDKWKKIGLIPQGEVNNLWQNYHFYVEKFFDKVKISKELKELDLKKNLEQKLQLCEKVEELLLESSIAKSFKLLQTYHEEWKEIGPVNDEKKEEIWERFKTASDTINHRRKEFYELMQTELQNNYNAKLVLCEQAEEFISADFNSIKEWNDSSDKVTDLLKVWKTLGPAPKKLNDEIWARFKSGLDQFFTNKKNFLQKIKEQQLNNYNLKINLCVEAEAITQRKDWKKATEELLKLQQEWKQTGAVPKKYSDLIWKRFRSACDEFFAAKSNYFSHQQENEIGNLNAKQELIEKAKSYVFTNDRSENLNALKELQRNWTEIGHVPISEKDKLYNAFKEAINKRYDELKASASEYRNNNYQHRIDDILNSPDADRVIEKERRFLQNKIQKIREDVQLWENNLGFFANSKNAQVLKDEFEKKIDEAKNEIISLDQKIKLLVKK